MTLSNFEYIVLDDKKKQIQLKYDNKTLKFQLESKRAFTVLKAVLEGYPDFINIHSLDGVLADPNRAHSDLRNVDGFSNFLVEKKDSKRVMHLKLNIPKLFEQFGIKGSDEFLSIGVQHVRNSLSSSEQKKIYEKFNGRCNITGIKVFYDNELNGNIFYKRSLAARFDHRIPLSKDGTNEFDNWQLLSDLANEEKNKICNICENIDCKKCALAFPEKYDTIQANGQIMKGLKVTEYFIKNPTKKALHSLFDF